MATLTESITSPVAAVTIRPDFAEMPIKREQVTIPTIQSRPPAQFPASNDADFKVRGAGYLCGVNSDYPNLNVYPNTKEAIVVSTTFQKLSRQIQWYERYTHMRTRKEFPELST